MQAWWGGAGGPRGSGPGPQVFCETKRGCDTLTRQLRQDGFPALCIHGDKSQQERDWVLLVGAPTPPCPPAHSTAARPDCPHGQLLMSLSLMFLSLPGSLTRQPLR